MKTNIKKNLKLLTLYASSAALMATLLHKEYNYDPKIEIIDEQNNDEPFARYSKGNVYIGNKEYINKIIKKININDVVILDARNEKDPNMVVMNSNKIGSKNEQNEILLIIEIYEEIYPTKWDRTIESMRNEWTVHNILYDFKYKKSHTEAVDLNNEDEEKYKSKILTKVLWN